MMYPHRIDPTKVSWFTQRSFTSCPSRGGRGTGPRSPQNTIELALRAKLRSGWLVSPPDGVFLWLRKLCIFDAHFAPSLFE